MLDLVLAAVVFTLIVALALGALAALTLVPFVLTLRRAEQRSFPPARWGAAALTGSVVGLLPALLAARADGTAGRLGLLLLAVLLSYAVPLLLAGLRSGQDVGGRTGRHA